MKAERVTISAQQTNKISAIWNEHLQVAKSLPELTEDVSKAVEMIRASLAAGGKLLIAGNGGSAADAQHIAAELTGRFIRERRPLPAIALHANTSALTAIGNDYGYDRVFSRQLEALARPGDVAFGISTSGNSPNVVVALSTAKSMGLHTVALTGRTGGNLFKIVDHCICVPSDETPRIQECHILIGHIISELAEREIFHEQGRVSGS